MGIESGAGGLPGPADARDDRVTQAAEDALIAKMRERPGSSDPIDSRFADDEQLLALARQQAIEALEQAVQLGRDVSGIQHDVAGRTRARARLQTGLLYLALILSIVIVLLSVYLCVTAVSSGRAVSQPVSFLAPGGSALLSGSASVLTARVLMRRHHH